MRARLANYFTILSITLLIVTLILPCYATGLSVEELGKVVVFLRLQRQVYEVRDGKKVEVWYKVAKEEYEPKKEEPSGTGFIIKYNGRDYLVTAKHVAQFLSKEGELILNESPGHTVAMTFGDLQGAKIISGAKWFFHPTADVAIHPLAYTREVAHLSLPMDFCSETDRKISLLSTVYALGFPLGLGVDESINPIAKKVQTASGYLSIHNQPQIDPNLKYLLLDQALSQGYSGSPVLLIEDVMSEVMKVGDKPVLKVGEIVSLVGVLSAQLGDVAGGKISLVVPTSYICGVLHSAEFIAYETNARAIK